MATAVGRLKIGAGQGVSQRAGEQDLACSGGRHDPRRGVDLNPTHLLAAHLTFTQVDTGPHL